MTTLTPTADSNVHITASAPSALEMDLPYPYDLDAFTFERVLDENAQFCFVIVLGTLPAPLGGGSILETETKTDPDPDRLPAILRIERTAFSGTFTDHLRSSSSTGIITSTRRIGHTDIYSWLHGWLARKDDVPDVKITVIFPATEVHIRKYSTQTRIMVTETPALYRAIVQPFIDAFPASRTQWIRDVLDGKAEADAILCRTPHFLILPDMKWDPSGPITSLYLLALVTDPTLRSLRDLQGGPGGHVALLEDMRAQAYAVVEARWGLRWGALRMYVHYQPSYYHFHVHIVHAAQDGTMGMNVGQAHLLEDIISMLTLAPNILSEMTMTYGLGSQHGLYDAMVAAQVGCEPSSA